MVRAVPGSSAPPSAPRSSCSPAATGRATRLQTRPPTTRTSRSSPATSAPRTRRRSRYGIPSRRAPPGVGARRGGGAGRRPARGAATGHGTASVSTCQPSVPRTAARARGRPYARGPSRRRRRPSRRPRARHPRPRVRAHRQGGRGQPGQRVGDRVPQNTGVPVAVQATRPAAAATSSPKPTRSPDAAGGGDRHPGGAVGDRRPRRRGRSRPAHGAGTPRRPRRPPAPARHRRAAGPVGGSSTTDAVPGVQQPVEAWSPRRAPSGRDGVSTLTTRAPARPSRCAHSGPAHSALKSTTSRPRTERVGQGAVRVRRPPPAPRPATRVPPRPQVPAAPPAPAGRCCARRARRPVAAAAARPAHPRSARSTAAGRPGRTQETAAQPSAVGSNRHPPPTETSPPASGAGQRRPLGQQPPSVHPYRTARLHPGPPDVRSQARGESGRLAHGHQRSPCAVPGQPHHSAACPGVCRGSCRLR